MGETDAIQGAKDAASADERQKTRKDERKDTTEQEKNPRHAVQLKTEKQHTSDQTPRAGADPNINFILDVPLHISAELGRTAMTIYELLQLGQGSIIELGKLAGEPVEVLVQQKLIARGEVVRVNDKLGVRLTDIITPQEGVRKVH